MKLLVTCALSIWFGVGLAQQKTDRPSFDVTLVKAADPNPDNPLFVGMSADRAFVRYGNTTLHDALRAAFRVRDYQIVAPEWMSSARFQIEGKMPAGALTDQIPEMLQSLLVDRFKLETRWETKEMNVYALLVGPDGPKLKPSELVPDSKAQMAVGVDGKPRQLVSWGGSMSGVMLMAPAASLGTWVALLSRFTAKPVLDLTGLDGLYNFNMKLAPEVDNGMGLAPSAPRADDSAPNLADALKQFGLRVESRKMPVQILVVTHMDKVPTEN
jgi:uncharacterized protein (TIGR03435 family)